MNIVSGGSRAIHRLCFSACFPRWNVRRGSGKELSCTCLISFGAKGTRKHGPVRVGVSNRRCSGCLCVVGLFGDESSWQAPWKERTRLKAWFHAPAAGGKAEPRW